MLSQALTWLCERPRGDFTVGCVLRRDWPGFANVVLLPKQRELGRAATNRVGTVTIGAARNAPSVLKGGRVVFNIKANDYRLIALVQYVDGVLMIRFFGSHGEYDGIDAETV